MALPTASYAVLSATTAKEIQGTEPYFKRVSNNTLFSSTNELLGFSYPDSSVPGGIKQISYNGTTQTITIPSGVNLDDIAPLFTPNTTGNYESLNSLLGTYFTVEDADGDASIVGNTSALGDMKIQLLKNGTVIAPTATTLAPCDSYQLKIDIKTGAGSNTVTAKTTYGYPDKKEYSGSTSATYNLISADAKLCWIQTGDMTVYSNLTATNSKFPYISAANPGGYNPAYWTYKGFNIANLSAAGKDFPTTGFRNARLTFIGSGSNQALYQCTISGGTWVTQSTTTGGTGCTLVYNSSGRPTGNITVTLKTNPTPPATAVTLGSYTIKAPAAGKWAEVGDPSKTIAGYTNSVIPYNHTNTFTGRYYAAESCGLPANTNVGASAANQATAGNYFFSRAVLTNAPNATAATPSFNTTERFSRDADGTFMGEWGEVYNYASSPWSIHYYYWASEAHAAWAQYTVGAQGLVRSDVPGSINRVVVCKR